MRIAIVCGHFVPEIGYVEVHLANAFHQLGYTVKVITSNKTSFSAKHLNASSATNSDYEIVRLAPWFSYGQIVLTKGIAREINLFQPQKVVVIGLGKVFPKEVFRMPNKEFELITLLGDNEDTYNNSAKSLKRVLLQKLFKTPIYELAIEKSDKLIGYTPSTKSIVDSFIKEEVKSNLDKKYSSSTLGFDDDEFYFSPEKRVQLREELGIDDSEIIVLTATRINEAKSIEKIIDTIARLVNKGVKLKYVLIGFSDTPYCQQLKKYIDSKQLDNVVKTLPFISRKQLVDYYNMADIGLWTQAAISIFEALGTGLFLLLPNKKNVSHVLTKETGMYYAQTELFTTLGDGIENIGKHQTSRSTLAESSRKQFSFKKIATEIIKD